MTIIQKDNKCRKAKQRAKQLLTPEKLMKHTVSDPRADLAQCLHHN